MSDSTAVRSAAMSTEQGSSLGVSEEPESKSRFSKLGSAVGRVPLIDLDDLDIGKVLGMYLGNA